MLHPSYTDLINAVNSGAENGEELTINSRYSIVIAASRRARQLIDKKKPNDNNSCYKPLSAAVDELYNGDTRIVSEDDIAEEDIDLNREFLPEEYMSVEAEEILDETAEEDMEENAETEVVAEAEEDME